MEKALPANLNEFIDQAQYREIVSHMIALAKKKGAQAAEVGLHASIGLNVSVRLGEVEILEFSRDKAVGITVYLGQQKGSASTTDISPDSLESTVNAALNLAKLTQPDPFAGLADKSELATQNLPLDLYHPWDLTVEHAIDLAKNCEKSALAFDKKIVNSEGANVSSAQSFHIYGNSLGFIGYYPTTKHSLSCTVIAQDAQGMERDYQYTLSRKVDKLDVPEQIGKDAASRALKRLSAKKLPTQRVPILFNANIASSILSHFMAAISGGRLFRKTSFLLDSLNKPVFPSHVHIFERPHILGGIGSAPFDSDGVKTCDKDIVVDGVLNSYILSVYSARRLGMKTTGNAGGIHNLFIAPTAGDFDSLVKKMHRGLVVMELMGQGVNLVNGDYSRGVSGFWVENGQIMYPVHEITIAGNLRDMFKQLVAVGNDVDERNVIQTGSLLIEEMTVAGV